MPDTGRSFATELVDEPGNSQPNRAMHKKLPTKPINYTWKKHVY